MKLLLDFYIFFIVSVKYIEMAFLSRVLFFAMVVVYVTNVHCAVSLEESSKALPLKESSKAALLLPDLNKWSFTASFGRAIPNTDKEVSPEEITMFIFEIMQKYPVMQQGFKRVATQGVWGGGMENSFDIVVLSDRLEGMWSTMVKICLLYKSQFKQESVALSYQRVGFSFL